jgi:shikimate dehydrogenase
MKIYGLLGKNISYSLSPVMYNAAFKALGLDAEYRIFDRDEDRLDEFFAGLKKGSISGCNVTIPYKEMSLGYVDECTGAARSIGAVNTIARSDAVLKGYNTDYQGFMKALRGSGAGDLDFQPKGKSAFIFGAGGAARSVVHSLLTLGIKKLIITDMDAQKAERLVGSIDEEKYDQSTIAVAHDETQYNDFVSRSDLLINATPCGSQSEDPRLFDYRYIHERLSVFDLIYALDTPLVKEARTRARRAVNGLNMLLYQAAAAFEIWIQEDAPVAVMRKALTERMAE